MQRFILAVACALGMTAAHAANWVSAWGAAPDSDGPALHHQSVRQQLRVSAKGERLRIRLSNAYGSGPMTIGPVQLARGGAAVAVLFAGRTTVTIPKGEDALSDAIALAVAPFDELTVGMVVDGAGPSTIHSDARQSAYVGDQVHASRYFLSEVQVDADSGARAIAIVGDSISDGDGSTQNRNARWPDALAVRLKGSSIAVLNSGISGNRLLHDGPVGPSMLQRVQRDAFDKPGVKWMVLEAGLNDVGLADEADIPGGPVTAAAVIAGMGDVIARAHARGIEVWGATLTPYGGAEQPLRHNPQAEAKRLAINTWIRGSGSFDRVLDFDAAVRDPKHSARLLPAFDSGDHVHPNDAGYRALAGAVPLGFFSAAAGPAAAPRR